MIVNEVNRTVAGADGLGIVDTTMVRVLQGGQLGQDIVDPDTIWPPSSMELVPDAELEALRAEIERQRRRRDSVKLVLGLLSTASMAAGAFHGYRRNESVGWALWWGLMGAMFPVITPTIAIAQGFGKRK